DLYDMKKRLKEMEDEDAALQEMQAKVEKEMGSVQVIRKENFDVFNN
ncbi:polyadenylate-binding protein 2-like, partial [Trifolium pratense]